MNRCRCPDGRVVSVVCRWFDQVSGGLTSGLGLLEAVQKEAWEEAGIPEHLLPGIHSAGAVS